MKCNFLFAERECFIISLLLKPLMLMKRIWCSCRGGLYVHPLARQGEIHQREGQSEGKRVGAEDRRCLGNENKNFVICFAFHSAFTIFATTKQKIRRHGNLHQYRERGLPISPQ